jgi:hypothetical protein
MAHAVPEWLAEVMRPKKVPMPWGAMVRSVIAIWVPLAIGITAGDRRLALLPAIGGLMSIMVDQGGTYRSRVALVVTAGIFGGAAGLLIGSLIHGRGWDAVVALVLVAGVSTIISRLGSIGSLTGLQLVVYSSLGVGPLGALRPWWHTALGFLAGVAWALLLLLPGWLIAPRSVERRLVATVYHDLAAGLRAIGTPAVAARRRDLTAALNAAYDAVLTVRRNSAGRRSGLTYLMAVLNVSHPMAEAGTALRATGERPPPAVTDLIDRLADAIDTHPAKDPLPHIPPQWSGSAGAVALRESIVGLSRVMSGNWTPPNVTSTRPPLSGLRTWAVRAGERLLGGWVAWTFTIRLMACMGVATVISEVLPLQRSYWVPLTVAIILKPDYGSVFARALQRGIGTVVGAVLGAIILVVVPFGPWLLLPFGVLAALLPYGKARNFGLSATFLTPLVVLLIDLLKPADWRLAGDRAIDTVVASAVVLVAAGDLRLHGRVPGHRVDTEARTVGGARYDRAGAAQGRPAAATLEAAPQVVPRPIGPAGRVPAVDVRADRRRPSRAGAVARGRRARGGDGCRDRDRCGGQPWRPAARPGCGAPAHRRTARGRGGDGGRPATPADQQAAAER